MRVTIIVCRKMLLMLLMVRVRHVPVVGSSVHVPVRLYDLLFGRQIVARMIFFVLRRVLSFVRWLVHIWIIAVLVWLLLLLLLLVVIIHIRCVRKVRIGFYKLPVLVNVTRSRSMICVTLWWLAVCLSVVWMWDIAVHRGYRHKRWILLGITAGVRI